MKCTYHVYWWKVFKCIFFYFLFFLMHCNLLVNWMCFSVSKTIERYQKRTKDELRLTGKSQENLQVWAFHNYGSIIFLSTQYINPIYTWRVAFFLLNCNFMCRWWFTIRLLNWSSLWLYMHSSIWSRKTTALAWQRNSRLLKYPNGNSRLISLRISNKL